MCAIDPHHSFCVRVGMAFSSFPLFFLADWMAFFGGGFSGLGFSLCRFIDRKGKERRGRKGEKREMDAAVGNSRAAPSSRLAF